jgi:outer membrane protein OmpA-like peptidoglycan-associated protein
MFKKRNEDDSFWIAAADLMACLMLVFMFVTFYYMHRYSMQKQGVYDVLMENFSDRESEDLGIEITKDGIIRFSEDAAFGVNESNLKPEFKNTLKTFLPRYLNAIYDKYKDKVMEIRIEGHTSSDYLRARNDQEAYIFNMRLSQDRARAVLEYMMSIEELKQKPGLSWIKEKVTANGLSSSRLIYNNGVEDKKTSKRVDFRILLNPDDN